MFGVKFSETEIDQLKNAFETGYILHWTLYWLTFLNEHIMMKNNVHKFSWIMHSTRVQFIEVKQRYSLARVHLILIDRHFHSIDIKGTNIPTFSTLYL